MNSNETESLIDRYKGAPDLDGFMGFACDAAPKKPQTLAQHLKHYHKGKMPKGDCSFLKQYKKDHPDWQKEAEKFGGGKPKVTKKESAVDTAKKTRIGKVKGGTTDTPAKGKEADDLTDDYINGIISRCEGRDWVNTGSTTSQHKEVFDRTKKFLEQPRSMLEHGPIDIWGIGWRGGDHISNMMGYYQDIGSKITDVLMNRAFDAATDDELRDFSLYAKYEKVRAEASRRYGEKHPELKYLPTRLENGYSRKPCWVKK